MTKSSKYLRKPEWLKIQLPNTKAYASVKDIVDHNRLNTICESGNCPNQGECWKAGTATFMILGDICTRSCKFCNVKTGKPLAVDIEEPKNIANSVKDMSLDHCVITSVDRDDLEDGGSIIWAETVTEIRKLNPNTTIETLIPDFKANKEQIQRIIDVKPEIVSHNLETVKRLTKEVRVQAKYQRSLDTLEFLSKSGITIKSGIMVGLGEKDEEIYETMDDLLYIGCKILTIGQYLQPTINHLNVQRYVTPEEFENYKKIGLKKGFKVVESGPLVRSSYHAKEHLGFE